MAQDRMAFVFIGELKRWNEWSLWAAEDPNMEVEYSDPSWGAGAFFKWKSKKFGEGEAKVTQFTPKNSVAYDLTLNDSLLLPSKWEFKMRPHPRQGVIVSWTVDGKYPENRFWRLIAYIKLWSLPKNMQTGLERLKAHAEKHEAYEVRGDWEK